MTRSAFRDVRGAARLFVALFAVAVAETSAGAQGPTEPPRTPSTSTSVEPGETVKFTTAHGGGISCAKVELAAATLPLPADDASHCGLPRYLGSFTRVEPGSNITAAASAMLSAAALLPGTASSFVYNQFTVAGDRHHDSAGSRQRSSPVAADLAIVYDYVTQLGGLSLHRHESSLTLRIEDITAGLPVGTKELESHDVSGDQGVTDVALGTVIVPVDDGTDTISVTLTRGHTYRIYFELSVTNFGMGGGRAEAQWSQLALTLHETDTDD
jgi:hypothetical protein